MSENDLENVFVGTSNQTDASKSYSSEYNKQVLIHVNCGLRGKHRLTKLRLQYSSEAPDEIVNHILALLKSG